VGSYLEAKSHDGEWLVRIENLDTPREISGASSKILRTLESLEMEWDHDVVYQSERNSVYQTTLAILDEYGVIYPCTCTRREIADSSITGVSGPVYPGTCRSNLLNKKQIGALRVITDNSLVKFKDALRGQISQRLESETGDFVLRRADGIYAYQLAVVVDDAEQGITHVVRGADLLDSTPRQIYLQKLLGYPTLEYMHLPVVVNNQGKKLSKQNLATPLDISNPVAQLIATVSFLGQEPPTELLKNSISSFWEWAVKNWCPEKIP
ncbi:MAG: tRNA glutamyl-Q(34) synthetase GluQRS, partial [Nitrosomonadaceae bacterium]